ncbi:MAG TPA: hypothetical protein VND87_05355 [Stellaceae bacterium]|nr:hypothetical protein [Stellaceae bacterium]
MPERKSWFAAHIDALHVRVDPLAVAVNTMVGAEAGGMLLESLIKDLERQIQEREASAHRIFTEFCAGEDIPDIAETAGAAAWSAQWHVETGQRPHWVATYAMTADLVVASRGAPGDEATARATIEAVLLETGRPLLIPSTAAPV